ncbi:uncharacterized protein LOC135094318 [Scylla paramamosain]|uniref:uncharacterized protein LOC135094318 n=1 Tax=Scylla paramamosain TaxID=85552 RepID=UPI003082B081
MGQTEAKPASPQSPRQWFPHLSDNTALTEARMQQQQQQEEEQEQEEKNGQVGNQISPRDLAETALGTRGSWSSFSSWNEEPTTPPPHSLLPLEEEEEEEEERRVAKRGIFSLAFALAQRSTASPARQQRRRQVNRAAYPRRALYFIATKG